MKIGVIGLGKMGNGIATRLLSAGHELVLFDQNIEASHQLTGDKASVVTNLEGFVQALPMPRIILLSLPAGEATNGTITYLEHLLAKGDTIVDCGNSHPEQSQQRAKHLAERELHFIDCGLSGGVAGKADGYCLMLGGEAEVVLAQTEMWNALAMPGGWQRVGPSGSGHYVKMVHNGIEYGMMQAYAEGLEFLKTTFPEADLAAITSLWQQGSIIRSHLGGLTAEVLAESPDLEEYSSEVATTSETRWMVQRALSAKQWLPVISAALMVRYQSKDSKRFGNRLLTALRNRFGGHPK